MAVFAGEVVVKVIGLGWQNYFRDKANTFDFIIVVISVTEWIIENLDVSLKAI